MFERLWRRAGRWYFHWLLLALAGFVVLVVVPLYSALLIPYFGASKDEYGLTVLAFLVVMSAAGAGMVPLVLRRHRPAVRWLAGERGQAAATATWESIVAGIPASAVFVAAWYAAACIPPAIYVADLVGLGLLATVGYCVALVLFVGGIAAPAYLVFEQAMRPIVRETASELPEDFEPSRRTVGIGTKVLILLPTITAFTGMLVAAASAGPSSLEGQVVASVVTTVLVTVTVAIGLTLIVRRSLLLRLEDLGEAIGRVDRGDLTAHLPRLAGDELDEVGGTFNRMVAGLRERAALHGALGSYVSVDLADRIARDGEIVQGEQVEVTILFADIREFTWLADRTEPADVVALLNAFFELVLPIITRHGGHANKLLGDGLLAVFGAPVADPDHARCAYAAGCEIVSAVQQRFDGELQIGLALNSGPVIAGTVGGPGKLDYTVIGDTVNVAARAEQLTKETGDVLLITAATRERLGDGIVVEPRGVHAVRGKRRGVAVFAVPTLLPPPPRTARPSDVQRRRS